ncbi:hypothetical protein HRbin36_01386 [bacterium HR36]|nr:hypothetical protein HRbin36_01386 [bacterium HR36]
MIGAIRDIDFARNRMNGDAVRPMELCQSGIAANASRAGFACPCY